LKLAWSGEERRLDEDDGLGIDDRSVGGRPRSLLDGHLDDLDLFALVGAAAVGHAIRRAVTGGEQGRALLAGAGAEEDVPQPADIAESDPQLLASFTDNRLLRRLAGVDHPGACLDQPAVMA